jgi:hypothetical protein
LEPATRARSFYPEQRCSFFEGWQKAKPGIGRGLRSIVVFKSEELITRGLFFSKAMQAQAGNDLARGRIRIKSTIKITKEEGG